VLQPELALGPAVHVLHEGVVGQLHLLLVEAHVNGRLDEGIGLLGARPRPAPMQEPVHLGPAQLGATGGSGVGAFVHYFCYRWLAWLASQHRGAQGRVELSSAAILHIRNMFRLREVAAAISSRVETAPILNEPGRKHSTHYQPPTTTARQLSNATRSNESHAPGFPRPPPAPSPGSQQAPIEAQEDQYRSTSSTRRCSNPRAISSR
jgi:hypothetical protein